MTDLVRSLSSVRDQLSDLYALIRNEEKSQIRRFEEEKPSLESLIGSLTKGHAILKAERKQIKAKLQENLDAQAKQAASAQKFAPKVSPSPALDDIENLQGQLDDLNERLQELNLAILDTEVRLSSSKRVEEKEIYVSKNVVMQDTKRILTEEISILRSGILRIEKDEQIEDQRKEAEESGFAELVHLEEQMLKTDAKMDLSRLRLYFPEEKGYRFTSGGSKVYFAAKDLFVSEISGRFDIDIEPVTKADGSRVARMKMKLSGVSGGGIPMSQPSGSKPPPQQDAASSARRNASSTRPEASSESPPSPESASPPKKTMPSTATTAGMSSAAGAATSLAFNDAAGVARAMTPSPSVNQANTSERVPLPPAASAPAPSTQKVDYSTLAAMHSAAMATAATAAAAANTAYTYIAPSSSQAGQETHWSPSPSASIPLELTNTSAGGGTGRGSGAGADLSPSEGGFTTSAAAAAAAAAFSSHAGNSKEVLFTSSPGAAPREGATPYQTAAPGRESADQTPPGLKVATSPTQSSAFTTPLPTHTERGLSSISVGLSQYITPSLNPPASRGLEIPKSSKTQKGELVAGFLSGLSHKKDKLKGILEKGKQSPIDPVALKQQDSVASNSSAMMEKESKGRFSKFAKAIANKAKTSMKSASTMSRTSSLAQFDEEPSTSATPSRSSAAPAVIDLDDHPFGRRVNPPANKRLSTVVCSSDEDDSYSGGTPPSPPQSYAPPPPPPPPTQSDPPELESSMSGGVDSLGFDEFHSRPSRKGIYVQLLGEHVEVKAERGTKIPDMTMKELLLELEVSCAATMEYTPMTAWQIVNHLDFQILQLEHKMRGNTFPLPKAALRALLNMFIPGAITKGLLGLLPVELGQYVLESGEKLHISGEFKLMGQALSTFVAPLIPTAANAKGKWPEAQQAAQRARSMLGLSEMQAHALTELFSGRGHLFGSEPPRVPSICELCRFYVQYSGSKLWSPMCTVWNKGLQLAFQHYGIKDRFTFMDFMENAVARMVRKPVRVAFKLDRLGAAVDVDALLSAMRSGFERLAREFQKRSQQGDENAEIPREPLEVQLENLQLWYQAMQMQIRTFKSRFRSASCGVLVSADRDVFQFGTEDLHYDGPLKLKIPMDVVLDPDNSFVWDIRLPDRQQYRSSMTTMLQEIMMSLAETVDIKDLDGDNNHSTPTVSKKHPILSSELNKIAKAVAKNSSAYDTGTPGLSRRGTAEEGGAGGSTGGSGTKTASVEVPVLENPVVGQISVKKISVSLKLDEERIARLLAPAATATATAASASSGLSGKGVRQQAGDAAAARIIGQLLGCYGDLFSTSLDLGWKDPDSDGHMEPKCMLTVANNDVTRVQAKVDSLMFQSSVSPKVAVRMLYAVVAGLMHRFYSADTSHMRFWDKLFSHLQEYFSKESLDVTLCLGAKATTINPPFTQAPSSESGQDPTEPKLRIVLTGDVGASTPGLASVCPVNVVNDVNLLTILESYKLAMERQIP